MLSTKEQKVLDLVDENQQEIVAYLSELIRFKTITPNTGERVENDEFKNFQALVCQTLDELGAELDVWEADATKLESFPGSGVQADRDLGNMPIVVGALRGTGGGKSLILNGHCDVVSPGLLENWRHDPFGGKVVDGKVHGRGAIDMKGGIAAMLKALQFIQRAGIELAGDVIVQIVPDEEDSCMGTLSCCQRGYRADAAIIPEPTSLDVLVAMRGSLYGIITVLGRAGHAEIAQPHWTEGGAVNAISKAVKVVQALEDLTEQWRTQPDKQHDLLDPDIIVPTVIKGGEWPVTYPEKVEITFGAQFLPGAMNKRQEIEDQLARVAALDPWLRAHPPVLKSSDAWHYGAEVSADEPIVQLGLEALADLGLEPGLIGCGSLTDAIHLINYAHMPTISIGPNYQTAHMTDEFIEIADLANTTKALVLAILRWSG
jgi:acetylornithine deacetylase